jgi:predicted dehydrogenase
MVTLALVGAGLRGQTHARHATASGLGHGVAVAEPDRRRRESVAAEFDIPAERVFTDWVELAAAGRLAAAAIVATQDRLHRAPAVRLADLGYHVLLEKPMAPTQGEAAEIAAAALRNGVRAGWDVMAQGMQRLLDMWSADQVRELASRRHCKAPAAGIGESSIVYG